jgi:hypothetical protein
MVVGQALPVRPVRPGSTWINLALIVTDAAQIRHPKNLALGPHALYQSPEDHLAYNNGHLKKSLPSTDKEAIDEGLVTQGSHLRRRCMERMRTMGILGLQSSSTGDDEACPFSGNGTSMRKRNTQAEGATRMGREMEISRLSEHDDELDRRTVGREEPTLAGRRCVGSGLKCMP